MITMKLKIILFGLIQGLTEGLPISSTGHLEIFETLLGLKLHILFEVFLHVGTLITTTFFFRSDIKKILMAFIKYDFKSREGAMIPKLFVSLISSAITGYFLSILFKHVFYKAIPLGPAFLLSGLLIYASKKGRCIKEHVDYKSAAIIGIVQGLSIIPGLSRSGLTISTAIILGIKREEAFKFSFILSIPAILGATMLLLLLQHDLIIKEYLDLEWIDMLTSCFVAMLSGYASLKFLHKFLHKFHMFALYLLPLGSLLILTDMLVK